MGPHSNKDHASRTGDIERTRSTPLLPVVWMTGVLVWATVVALFLRVPAWAGVFLCTLTAISFSVFVVGYLYLFTKDREALRAESWRRSSRGALSPDVTNQQRSELKDDERRYLEPERPGLGVTYPNEAEQIVGREPR